MINNNAEPDDDIVDLINIPNISVTDVLKAALTTIAASSSLYIFLTVRRTISQALPESADLIIAIAIILLTPLLYIQCCAVQRPVNHTLNFTQTKPQPYPKDISLSIAAAAA